MQEKSYAEQVIVSFQRRLGLSRVEAKEKGISGEERKADVIRKGKTVKIITKANTIYTPDLWIQDMDSFEEALKQYIRSHSRN